MPKERRSGGSRGVELTLQPLALEGATPMWQKFQHFAVDIPRHHREAEHVRWALHIYTALLLRVLPHTLVSDDCVSLGYRLVNVLYRTLVHAITLIFLRETRRCFRVDSQTPARSGRWRLGYIALRHWWDM